MIDFDAALVGMERQKKLIKEKSGRSFVKEFLYGKCHYFTSVAADLVGSNEVVVFYLECSGRIIHSAVSEKGGYILDVLGVRSRHEVQSEYDAMNSMTGIYHSEGCCKYYVVSLGEFNPDTFYREPASDLVVLKDAIKQWLAKLNSAKYEHI